MRRRRTRHHRARRLTPNMLKRMVLEEKAKMVRETSDPVEAGIEDPEKVDADETEADELADTLALDIDYIKVLKIKEGRLRRQLRKVAEQKRRLKSRLIKNL